MIELRIAAIRSSPPCEAAIVMPAIVSAAMLEDPTDNVTRRNPPGLGAAAENPSSSTQLRGWPKSGGGGRAGQGGLEEPADEFRLTVGSGFR